MKNDFVLEFFNSEAADVASKYSLLYAVLLLDSDGNVFNEKITRSFRSFVCALSYAYTLINNVKGNDLWVVVEEQRWEGGSFVYAYEAFSHKLE